MTMVNITNMQPLRQKQEDPLNLRSLPLVAPDADGWPEIQDALLQQGRRRNVRRLAGGSLGSHESPRRLLLGPGDALLQSVNEVQHLRLFRSRYSV